MVATTERAITCELLEALQYLVQTDTDICENRGPKSYQAMNRIAALDMANTAIANARKAGI